MCYFIIYFLYRRIKNAYCVLLNFLYLITYSNYFAFRKRVAVNLTSNPDLTQTDQKILTSSVADKSNDKFVIGINWLRMKNVWGLCRSSPFNFPSFAKSHYPFTTLAYYSPVNSIGDKWRPKLFLYPGLNDSDYVNAVALNVSLVGMLNLH